MFPDSEVAAQSPAVLSRFLKMIGLNIKLSDVNVPEEELGALAKQCMVLPDYQGNPRVATPEEMLSLVKEAF
jgi:alcohol dehydrogenase class IV